MTDQINQLKNIFEYEIKRKLSQRARLTADEYRILMNGFKFYDYDYTGKVNETEFVKGILRTGLSGFNEADIRSIFKNYDINNTGYINYKNFCDYLYGREPLNPLPSTQNNSKDQENTNNNEQLNQRQKTPIINNQRQKTPINQNINNTINNNNIENKNLPENNNQIQQGPQAQFDQNQQNIDPNQTKEYFKKLIIFFKEQIHTNNGLTYYTFLFELKNVSDQSLNISLDNFINTFKNLGINIPQSDIINFFNLLDLSGVGTISLDDIISTIVDPMNQNRNVYVVNKFAIMDVEKQGEVKVSFLKEKYNPKGHPDVISGKANEEEIFKQFCYTLDIYCNIRRINENINYKQFIEYYDGISSSIIDDKYFEDMINGVWDDFNLNSNNNPQINDNNFENNVQQEQINSNSNSNYNMNNIIENRNLNKNIPEIQNMNNERYNNNQQNNRMEKQSNNFNSSYCDENIGINSLFLGESTHVLPKSFGKKNFKRQRPTFNQQNINNSPYQNKQIINNIKSNEFSQNNPIRNNLNKTPISQSQTIPVDKTDLNQIQINNNNNFNSIMNNNRHKRLKIAYNPITNEYTPINSYNNNNSNQNGRRKTPLNQININNNNSINNSDASTNNTSNTINNNQNNNNNINNQNNEEQMIISPLNKLKAALIFRGTHVLFSFQRKLSIYDLNHQGLVSLNNFLNIAQAYTMNLSADEAKLIFELFDKDKKGSINYNELIQTVIGPINPHRQIIIQKVFDHFNKDNNGKVSINEIKILFNSRGHPDFISGKKNEGEILGEFLDNIESYKEYLENLKGVYDNNFSLDDFINFYSEISVGIEDDKKFEFMMYNCWNLNRNVGNNMNDMSNYGGNIYKKNTGTGYRNNNINSGNLMARAGSEIINNKRF